MGIKTWFIEKTNREGLLYSFVDNLLFKIQKYSNWLVNGHFVKKSRINTYFKNNSERKLNVGCGNTNYKNYLNTDIFGKIPIDITKKLPFKENSFDVIYSDHVVEHIYMKEFRTFLKESHRILKKGGINIIQTPSLEKISKIMYDPKKADAEFIIRSHAKLQNKKVTKASYINDVSHLCFGHKYLYDFELVQQLAKEAGYKKIIRGQNYKLPDKDIKPVEDKFWNLVTETFILYK